MYSALRTLWNRIAAAWRQDEKPHPNADYQFFTLAIQYYIAARSSALASSMPVTGNLFHHTVEMLLKGYLAQTMPLGKLKNMRHGLWRIWKKFRREVGKESSEDLCRFNGLIKELDRFQGIRYPGFTAAPAVGVAIEWSAFRSWAELKGKPLNMYRVNVPEIDAFISELFRLCHLNVHAYTGPVTDHGRAILEKDNPHCHGWFIEPPK
jgi:hypothetical protein